MKPSLPNDLKFTAHGYINMTSTSKSTKRMAIKKYLTENGLLAFPNPSIPHSKFSAFLNAYPILKLPLK